MYIIQTSTGLHRFASFIDAICKASYLQTFKLYFKLNKQPAKLVAYSGE
jgi:hypothetical protein